MKKTISRREFISAISTSTVLALAGCRDKNDNQVWPEQKDVRVLYFAGLPEKELISRELKRFTRETNLSVQFKDYKYDALRPEIEMSFSPTKERRPFDVIFVDDIWLRDFAENGRLIELTRFVNRDGDVDEFNSDYTEAILKAEAYWPPYGANDSKLYLIPHRADVQVLFYNKAIFEDASVLEAFKKITKRDLYVPETWEEYVTTAKALTGIPFQDGLITGCAETLKPSHFAFEFFACRYWAMAGAGNDFFDSSGTSLFVSSAGINAINHFQELLSAGALVSGSLTADHESTIRAFGNGRVALCPQWYTFYPTLKGLIKNLGVALLPGVSNQAGSILRTPSIGGGSFGIPSNSSNPENGWAFIKYFTDKPFSESSAQQGAVVPRNSTYMKPEVSSTIPELDVYRNSLEISRFRPRVAHFTEVETIIGSAISQAIMGTKEQTKATLEEAAAKVQALTKNNKSSRA